jgi:hypothetical protein
MANKKKDRKKKTKNLRFMWPIFPVQIWLVCKINFLNPMVNFVPPPPPRIITQVTLMTTRVNYRVQNRPPFISFSQRSFIILFSSLFVCLLTIMTCRQAETNGQQCRRMDGSTDQQKSQKCLLDGNWWNTPNTVAVHNSVTPGYSCSSFCRYSCWYASQLLPAVPPHCIVRSPFFPILQNDEGLLYMKAS